MTREQTRILTDIIYKALFGKDTAQLLIHFGLSPMCLSDPDDTDLRDCMGLLALQALVEVESACIQKIGDRWLPFEKTRGIVQWTADEVAIEAKATAAGRGEDLLTGVCFEVQYNE